jgi:hypothetical protein
MIEERTRKVFYSPKAGRCYLTKRAAIYAEARAIIEERYPSENAEDDTGYEGWYWKTSIPRSDVLLRRVARLVKRSTSPNVKLRGWRGLLRGSPARTLG